MSDHSNSMNYFPLSVKFEYEYSLGELKPYFDALQKGIAIASKCPKCGTVSFPPRLICAQDHHTTTLIKLQGTGQIKCVTNGKDADGKDVSFALISMDGADNLSLGRVSGEEIIDGDRVQLGICDLDAIHPVQCALFFKIPTS